MTHAELTSAIEAHGDGVHFFVATWVGGAAKAYVVDPSVRYDSETDAELAGARKMGTRLVRYTVHQRKITTIRRLS